jgi:hypothetical protein
MLWVVVAWNAQSGFSSSGPMNLQFAPSLLVVLSVPVSVFAPWAARVLGARLQWAAALAVVALTCWWQFWLPATMVDIGYSVRYDIPNPYIWPGQPGSPALALSVALWLTAPLSDWEGWRPWACWTMGSVCTTAAVLGLDWKIYIHIPWQVAFCCFVGLIALVTARHQIDPAHRITRWLILWAVGMMGLVVFWFATESVAGWVPRPLNDWFVGWLYP